MNNTSELSTDVGRLQTWMSEFLSHAKYLSDCSSKDSLIITVNLKEMSGLEGESDHLADAYYSWANIGKGDLIDKLFDYSLRGYWVVGIDMKQDRWFFSSSVTHMTLEMTIRKITDVGGDTNIGVELLETLNGLPIPPFES